MPDIESTIALRLSLSATFDSSGVAESAIGVPPHQKWNISLMNTNTTSTSQTQVHVYVGTQQVDTSVTANADSSNTNITMQQGETLRVVWSGGTVGANAMLDVQGTIVTKGRRYY